MYPILFTWHEGALYTYTTLFSLGVVMGGYFWVQEGRRLLSASIDSLINASIAAFFAGLFGARLLFILTNLENYRTGLFEIANLSSGGIVFYGGAIGGAMAIIGWAKKNRYPLGTTFNAMTPGLAFGHAIGRLGCLAHGCCYGKTCTLPWGIVFKNPRALARPLNTPLHPTQIYEILGLLALGWLALKQNQKNQGQAFRFYLLGYGFLRFTVEFFRGDELRGSWQGLSTSQWVSIAMIICSLFLDFRDRSGHNSAHENRT